MDKLKKYYEKRKSKAVESRDIRTETYKFIGLKQKILIASCDMEYLSAMIHNLKPKSHEVREFTLLLNESIGILSHTGELPDKYEEYKEVHNKLKKYVSTLQLHCHKANTLCLLLESFKKSDSPANKSIKRIEQNLIYSFRLIRNPEYYNIIRECIKSMSKLIEDMIMNHMSTKDITDETKKELKETYDEVGNDCE